MTARAADFQALYPVFYDLVKDFPDFRVTSGLTGVEVAELEKALAFKFAEEARQFFSACAALEMNGLSIRADRLAVIKLPDSDALLLGEFYLHSPADRLIMRAGDAAVHYLAQNTGEVMRLADSLGSFFEKTLPRCL